MELWLIRHAESWGNVDGSQTDTALSTDGRTQARQLGAALAGETFDLVLSSPLIRALETAALALPEATVVVEERLGEWRTLRDTFLDPATLGAQGWEQLLRAPTKREESFADFQDRLRAWLDSLPQTGRVVAFTHYAVVRECVWLTSRGAHVLEDVPHCHPFRVPRRNEHTDPP